jgi:hypothetical protein
MWRRIGRRHPACSLWSLSLSPVTPPETVGRVRREETSLDDVSIKAARDRLHHRARIKVEIGIVNT